jgi:hypothetical protein
MVTEAEREVAGDNGPEPERDCVLDGVELLDGEGEDDVLGDQVGDREGLRGAVIVGVPDRLMEAALEPVRDTEARRLSVRDPLEDRQGEALGSGTQHINNGNTRYKSTNGGFGSLESLDAGRCWHHSKVHKVHTTECSNPSAGVWSLSELVRFPQFSRVHTAQCLWQFGP